MDNAMKRSPITPLSLLLATLAGAFSLVLVFTVFYGARSQSQHLEEYTEKYVEGISKSYFDALNTMMVTGTIGNRDVLREKVTAPEDVLDVRVIRSDQLNAMYGQGNESERSREPVERQALDGERPYFSPLAFAKGLKNDPPLGNQYNEY